VYQIVSFKIRPESDSARFTFGKILVHLNSGHFPTLVVSHNSQHYVVFFKKMYHDIYYTTLC